MSTLADVFSLVFVLVLLFFDLIDVGSETVKMQMFNFHRRHWVLRNFYLALFVSMFWKTFG